MADFDPDKYLTEKAGISAAPFNPDKYLAEKTGRAPAPAQQDDPLEGMSALSKGIAAAGGGMLNMGRSAFELLSHVPGLSGLAPDKEKWAEQKKSLADLMANSGHGLDIPYGPGMSFRLTPGNVGNFTGETIATLPAAMIGGGAARLGLGLAGVGAADGLPLLARSAVRAAPLVSEGAAQGAVLGGPGNRMSGALVGGALGGGSGAVTGSLADMARGLVTPTAEARALMERGVNPSIGQMNPRGFFSKIEEAGQHSAFGGDSIHAARQAPKEELQRLMAQDVAPPGHVVDVDAGKDMNSTMDDLAHAFDKAYDPIRATPMPAHYQGMPVASVMRTGFKATATDPAVLAPDSTRAMVDKFLQNQATILDKVRRFELAGKAEPAAEGLQRVNPLQSLPRTTAPLERRAFGDLVENTSNMRSPALSATEEAAPTFTTADSLLTVRSNIRREIRGLMRNNGADKSAVPLLRNAEQMVTGALEDQMGPEAAAQLRAVDGQYAKFKTLENAVARAGDSELGVTSAQLQAAVKQATPQADYARGGGGSLRDISRLGRAVLENKAPMTGAIKQTLPFGLNHAAGPLGAFLNGPGRNFALGTTRPQVTATSLLDILQQLAPERAGAGNFVPSPNAALVPLEVRQR